MLQQLTQGVWSPAPPEGWRAEDVAIAPRHDDSPDRRSLFIAMDTPTWLRGSGKTGVYAGWQDTHDVLPRVLHNYWGAIVQRPLAGAPPGFPQLIVGDSYEALMRLARAARPRMTGKVVAVTGTVGKSSTTGMLAAMLGGAGSVVATRGNHNSRSGTLVTLARCITNPDFAVFEVALSALWTRNGGVSPLIQPDLAIITEIGVSQVGDHVRTSQDTARFKARICRGIRPGGHAILNRDMAEFALAAAEVAACGASVVSYGFSPEADVQVMDWAGDHLHSRFRIRPGGRELSCQVNAPGRAMAANAVAALTAVSLFGLDIDAAAERLLAWSNPGKLQMRKLDLPGGGQAVWLDDNYSAELASMKAAFEVAAAYPLPPGRRRVAALGRVVNLGERAQELHASLAMPLMEAGFDAVYLHGDETRALNAALPAGMSRGVRHDARLLAREIVSSLQDGDLLLVKGSARASDSAHMGRYLREAAQQAATATATNSAASARAAAPAPVALQQGETAELVIDLADGSVLHARAADRAFTPDYLGHLALLLLFAETLAAGEIAAHDRLPLSRLAPATAASGNLTGLSPGQELTAHDAMRAMVAASARDAAVSLGDRMFGSSIRALDRINRLLARLGARDTVLRNVSGRRQSVQRTTLADVATLMRYFHDAFPHRLHWLNATEVAIGGGVLRSASNLVARNLAAFAFMPAAPATWGAAIARVNGRDLLACVAGASSAFNRDHRIASLIGQAAAKGAEPDGSGVISAAATAAQPEIRVNFLGDTYFGEWYTRRRRARGIEDGLTRHGYDHSFAARRPLLDGGHVNIANLEAALTSRPVAPMQGRKPFLLTGDPDRTVAALARAGVHAVALANNHALDAGVAGLNDMLDTLDRGGVARFGAGRSAREAEAPLRLRLGGREWKVFSAYWRRAYMDFDCQYYAMGDRAGVACIEGGLEDAIRAEKAQSRPASVIVLAHWGVDFGWTSEQQRRLARQIIAAGADLIIGSGPHMMGEFEQIDRKWVLYSIGNGVFNSNGEYRQRGVPPYSFVAQLAQDDAGRRLRLFPIVSDNLATFWQPRRVNRDEFGVVLAALRQRGVAVQDAPHPTLPWADEDEAGPFIALPAMAWTSP